MQVQRIVTAAVKVEEQRFSSLSGASDLPKFQLQAGVQTLHELREVCVVGQC